MTTASQTPDFYWKAHDTAPDFMVVLADSNGPINVTAATVKLIAKAYGALSATPPKINATGIVVDGAAGIVSYTPISADTDTAGDYNAEWEVTFPGGRKQTFPDPGYLLLRITADLDGA